MGYNSWLERYAKGTMESTTVDVLVFYAMISFGLALWILGLIEAFRKGGKNG